MIDYFKVAMNETDRRIKLEVYSENLVKAIESDDVFGVKVHVDLLKEILAEPFDKYEGAE